jgi:hypothetical protein
MSITDLGSPHLFCSVKTAFSPCALQTIALIVTIGAGAAHADAIFSVSVSVSVSLGGDEPLLPVWHSCSDETDLSLQYISSEATSLAC